VITELSVDRRTSGGVPLCQIPSFYGRSASLLSEWLRAVPGILLLLGTVNAGDRCTVTVIEALGARDLPPVVAPIRDAEPVIAQPSVEVGAAAALEALAC
jgi:hypothetical protein